MPGTAGILPAPAPAGADPDHRRPTNRGSPASHAGTPTGGSAPAPIGPSCRDRLSCHDAGDWLEQSSPSEASPNGGQVAKLSIEVVTAERSVASEADVDMVIAPASEGDVGILPRHAPLLATLRPGTLRIKKSGEETEMAVSGGFLQVNRDRILILADAAERGDEIDEQRAEEARKRAEGALEEAAKGGSPAQVTAARVALRHSLVRLNVARRRRRRS
jgi:F-type H+-transporting ATPase subunit epsilon